MGSLKGIFNHNLIILFLSLGLIFCANTFQSTFQKPKVSLTKEQTAFNFSSESLKLIQFGHSRLTSSLLWMVTLLESDIEHYRGDKNSWMYYRFKTIADLEPRFYLNYLIGGQYLAIIKNDVYGADRLFATGLEYYPHDFKLNFHKAFNLAFEIGDIKQSLKFFDTILDTNQTHKGPPNLITLINKLKYESGEITLADSFRYLENLKETMRIPIVLDQINKDLYAIKAEIDLKCLNSKSRENCDSIDYHGEKYILRSGQWYSKQPWTPYQIHKK